MRTLLRMSLAAAAVLCLLPAGAQTPAGNAVSDFGYAVGVVERAYAGYPDKTAGREAEYAALKARLQSEISGDRDVYDAIAEYLGWRGLLRLGLRKPGRRHPRQYGWERQCL